MTAALPIPVVLPLLGAGLSMAFHRRVSAQRTLSLVAMVATTVASTAALIGVRHDGVLVVDVGGWGAPVGITLVADTLSALMLVVANLMLLAVLIYAIGSPRTSDHAFFHPVYLILATGVSLSFLTGDLFNLFVAFEVMLSASYVLITLGATRDQVRAGMTYVVISLLGSTLFLTAVALVYAATGTVNLADLVGRLEALPAGVRSGLGLLLLVVFGIKAAMFPLFFWLPDSYPTAPTPVTAILAALLTKVGLYAIIRTQTLLFAPDSGVSAILLFLAGATMLVGILGAIAQEDVKRVLSFQIISHIGYMIMGLAFFTVAGLAGAIFYVVHHIVVTTALFLVAGLIEEVAGSAGLRRLSGLAHSAPVVAVLFLLPALSLAGVPPLSGFAAKLALVQAGLAVDRYVVVGVSLLVSLLTLFSIAKIWAGAFWGDVEADHVPGRLPAWMVVPTAGIVMLSLIVTVAAAPVYTLSSEAAADLSEPDTYVAAVLSR